MRSMAKIIIIALVVLAIAVYLIFHFFAEPPPPPVSVPPSVQLLESRLVGRKDGARQWEIWAQSVLQAGESVTLNDMDEIIMFQDDEPYLFIDAQRAVWERKPDILYLHDAVVRDEDETFYLESDLLIWAGSEETLASPESVFIRWQGLEIDAAEMLLKAQENLLYLKDDVRIRDGSMLWRVESAVYDLDQERMEFFGSLVLEEEVGESE